MGIRPAFDSRRGYFHRASNRVQRLDRCKLAKSEGRLRNAMSRGFRAPSRGVAIHDLGKYSFMNRDNSQHLRPFWRIQITGWGCFNIVYDLLASIHAFLT